jgi:hypothetical protein
MDSARGRYHEDDYFDDGMGSGDDTLPDLFDL